MKQPKTSRESDIEMNGLEENRSTSYIEINDYLWYLLLMPLMTTNGLIMHIPILSRINDILAFFSILIVVSLYIKIDTGCKTGVLRCVFALYLYVAIRSFFARSDANWLTIIRPIGFGIGLCVYILCLIDEPTLLIQSFLFNLEFDIYINFITLLLFPQGLYMTGSGRGKCWFLGYDNWWYIILYIAIFVSVLHYKLTGSLGRTLFLLMTINATAFITGSGVLIFGCAFMDIMLLTKLYRLKLFNYRNLCIAIIVINVLIFLMSSSWFVTYFVELTGRPISTLAIRNRIWNTTLQSISKNLILGSGRQSSQFRTQMYDLLAGANAHNMWLEILYQGGLVGGGLFALMLIITGSSLTRVDNTEIKQLLLLCILTCGIGLSVDSVFLELRGSLFFAMFVLASNLDILIESIPRNSPLFE